MERRWFGSTLLGSSVGAAVVLLILALAFVVGAGSLSPNEPRWRSLLLAGLFLFAGAAVCGLWALLRPLRPPRERLARRAALVVLVAGGLGYSWLHCGLSQDSHRRPRNESAAIGDIRALLSAQYTYQSANGGHFDGDLECLLRPVACIPGYPPDAPSFLGEDIASLAPGQGYQPAFHPGPPPEPIPPQSSPSSVTTWAYITTPTAPGYSGIRSFCGDSTGQICARGDGSAPPLREDGTCDLERCRTIW
jgi:hypothetical protein